MKMYFKNALIYRDSTFTSVDALFDGNSFNILDHGIADTDIVGCPVYNNCYQQTGSRGTRRHRSHGIGEERRSKERRGNAGNGVAVLIGTLSF